MESNSKNYCSVGVIMDKKNMFQVRMYQSWMKLTKLFSFIKEPEKYVGSGTLKQINHVLLDKKHQIHNVFIVTGPQIYGANLLAPVFDNLKRNGINYTIYSGVKTNPTEEQIETGVVQYKEKRCEAIVAIGGGSVIDAAKCIAARIGNPKEPLKDMIGVMKVKNTLPLLVAVPTTAGSGSESSCFAVISDKETNSKQIIMDPKLMPKFIILDPELTINLSKEQIAISGMNALSRAVEAYVSKGHTFKSDKYAIEATKLICDNLELAYSNTEKDKNALKIHENLLLGAHYAGLASSRANVGFCDVISNSIREKYDIPQGTLNALLLPYVLKAYGEFAIDRLANLADQIAYRISVDSNKKAEWMINRIESLNSYIGIKNNLDKKIHPKDIRRIATNAFEEATPTYPAPKMLTVVEIENLLNEACK